MTTTDSSIALPQPIVERLAALGSVEAQGATITAAMSAALRGSVDDRRALMQSALPLMKGPRMDFVAASVDVDVRTAFQSYCASKGLRADVLLAGALIQQLGITVPSTPRARKAWWKFW